MHLRCLATALLVLACLGMPSPAAAEPPTPAALPQGALGVVEPALLKQALQSKGGELRFVVEMREQASLDGLPALPPGGASPEDARVARAARTAVLMDRLRETAATSQAPLLADLSARQAAGQVVSYQPLWISNAVAVTAGRETLLAVAARPEVRLVRLDRRRQWIETPPAEAGDAQSPAASVEWNISRVRADQAWAALGLDGSGVVVANVDTGVDWLHPALAATYRGYTGGGPANHTGNWVDVSDGGYLYPGDANGHGTHTMGTLAGAGGIGVAPGARWIAVKAFDAQGYAYDSWLHAAFQWLLAPAGDQALAPDVVNNSWGTGDSTIEVFAPDLKALAAAGIVSIFSAGNEGPAEGTVTSPASLPGVFSVGAIDSSDVAAVISGRGPSPWGEVKPALAAPGVDIRSSTPGGAYQRWQGTSMAAPHAAGAAALLLQARPGLDPAAVSYALTSTAMPLRVVPSDTVPNNTFGWGRLDVLGAALSVAATGSLSGTVSAAGGAAVPGATVDVWGEESGLHAVAVAGSEGRFAMPLAAGPYTVTASAFGYQTSAPVRVIIAAGAVSVWDFTLAPLPTGTISGRVFSVDGQPLAAMVTVSGTAVSAETNPRSGIYNLTLPPGAYDLRVESWGFRLGNRTGVAVQAGSVAQEHFTLEGGPNVLVVDSGAWYNDRHGAIFAAGLEDLGYVHAVRPITYSSDLPALSELTAYDVVIWSAPQDSPGLIRADTVLSNYLGLGGRLLITGQDVAYWDGGGSSVFYSPVLDRLLHARFIKDAAGSDAVVGLALEPFAGVTLALNTADSARNQHSPDVVAPFDAHAAAVAAYGSGETAGLRADVCLDYRALFVSFGLEGAGPAENRRVALDRAIAWLMSSRPNHDLSVTPAGQAHVGPAGSAVTGTLRLWNTGAAGDAFTLTAVSPWPLRITDAGFGRDLAGPVTVSSCQAITVGVAVTIPHTALRDTRADVTVTVASAAEPALQRSAGFAAKTPASLLLVDDDRWYQVEGVYTATLAGLGRGHDVWDTKGMLSSPWPTPAERDLAMYPAVVWMTGYDWFQPLTGADEAALAGYLDGGGRLFFSSQDYLYVSGLSPFNTGYLGVLTYTNDVTATTETGAPGSPIGEGLGPYTPTTVYHMWPDVVTPTTAAIPAFLNPDGNATSLTLDGGGFRTAFLTFPFEALPADGRLEVMRRALAWFGPLRASTFAVDQTRARPGGILAYALTVENPGETAAQVAVTNTLPAGLTLAPDSLEGGDWDGAAVTWSSAVAAGGYYQIRYRAAVAGGFRGWVTNQALVASGGESFTVTARTLVPAEMYLPLVSRK